MSVDEIATGVHNLSHRLHATRLQIPGWNGRYGSSAATCRPRTTCTSTSSTSRSADHFVRSDAVPVPRDPGSTSQRVQAQGLACRAGPAVARSRCVAVAHHRHRPGISRPSGDGGLGLVSMRACVHFEGGPMALRAMVGQGTRIHVSVSVSRDGVEFAASRRCSDMPESSGEILRVQGSRRFQLVC
jgi:hypothetical protein